MKAGKEMSKVSSIPQEILQYRPCSCCRIRHDGDIYRVYRYKAVKLASGKWSSNYGELIGKIIPGKGFCPNKRYIMEQEKQSGESFSDGITDVAYGQYALLNFLSKDILEKLEKYFSIEEAAQIYAYSLILCANGFIHIDQIDEFYQESILSILYKKYSFRMGYVALSALLKNLGMKTNPVCNFEQDLIDSCSKNIAIDGHVIRSCSEENDLAEAGYKMNQLKAPQVNLLIAYDVINKVPLMYKTFRGSSVDKKSVEEFLQSRSFTNTKFIVDKGFYSSTVLHMMSENNNSYIIPLPSNSKDFSRIKAGLEFSSGEFVYKAGKKDCARVLYYEESIDENTRIIVYKDVDENNSKRKSYKQHMELGESGYSQETYDEICDWWGVFFLQTNTTDPAFVVYSDYKARWSIETYNNYIKNDADFNNLKIQDYYVQNGFDFIMLVTGLIHTRLNEAVKVIGKSSISTFDVMVKAGHMRMVSDGKLWNLRNTRKKDLELFKIMEFIPEKSIPI